MASVLGSGATAGANPLNPITASDVVGVFKLAAKTVKVLLFGSREKLPSPPEMVVETTKGVNPWKAVLVVKVSSVLPNPLLNDDQVSVKVVSLKFAV